MEIIIGISKKKNNGTLEAVRVVERLTSEIRKQMKGGRGGGVEILDTAEMKWKRVEINWGQFSRPAM
jgi:hypothetical protein